MKRILLSLAFISVASNAHATVLFSNPYPSAWGGGWCSPCNGTVPDYRVWDTFTLGSASAIQTIEFVSHDITPGGENLIDFSVWDQSRTTVLFSTVLNNTQYTQTLLFSPDNFVVNASVGNWTLGAGTYSLSIFGQGGTQFGWRYSDTPVDASTIQRSLVSNTDFNRGTDQAFTLAGTVVPEPSTLLMIGLGLAGVSLRRLQR